MGWNNEKKEDRYYRAKKKREEKRQRRQIIEKSAQDNPDNYNAQVDLIKLRIEQGKISEAKTIAIEKGYENDETVQLLLMKKYITNIRRHFENARRIAARFPNSKEIQFLAIRTICI